MLKNCQVYDAAISGGAAVAWHAAAMLPTDHWSVAQRRWAEASEGPAAMAAQRGNGSTRHRFRRRGITTHTTGDLEIWLRAASRAFLNWLAWDHIRAQTKAQNVQQTEAKLKIYGPISYPTLSLFCSGQL